MDIIVGPASTPELLASIAVRLVATEERPVIIESMREDIPERRVIIGDVLAIIGDGLAIIEESRVTIAA
jgi:hypothetical protein